VCFTECCIIVIIIIIITIISVVVEDVIEVALTYAVCSVNGWA